MHFSKTSNFCVCVCVCVCVSPRESLLAEMGVSIKEDGGTLGVFSPKGVSLYIII